MVSKEKIDRSLGKVPDEKIIGLKAILLFLGFRRSNWARKENHLGPTPRFLRRRLQPPKSLTPQDERCGTEGDLQG